MRRYTIEIWITDEREATASRINRCEEVSIMVRAENQDHALALGKSVLEEGEWESRRILEYDVQEVGEWEDDAKPEIISYPIRKELIRKNDSPFLKWLSKFNNNTKKPTTSRTEPRVRGPVD
ncbi:MAG: hypothetical protein JJU05_16140 [Verrucomicrobia bacterium]|nr:hypothetical protein [Verrucomicrobiota bacterium]MCC5845778.1 hypothetical protein [Verrucomicrobiota bacterium]